jgi:hypothetical protein
VALLDRCRNAVFPYGRHLARQRSSSGTLPRSCHLIWRSGGSAFRQRLSAARLAAVYAILGGILLLNSNRAAHRLGRLFAFAGFAINLYAMVFLWIGFWTIGRPMHGLELWFGVVLAFLGVLAMICLAVQTMKESA